MTFKIEKNIPVPERGRRRNSAYPWPDLKIGDSFLAPLTKEMSVRNAISSQHKAYKARYTAKRTPQGIRVWRVK